MNHVKNSLSGMEDKVEELDYSVKVNEKLKKNNQA